MLLLYINGSDRTGDLLYGDIALTDQIQQRTNSLDFTIFQNTKPTENQDVKLYASDTIASIASATIVLNGYFERNVNRFYPGQILFLGIGTASEEKVTVLTYTESTLTIVLTAAPVGSFSPGDKIGDLLFGGVVSRVKDKNITVSQNIEYEITCVDYTKPFDKKIVGDTWQNVDSRYIINDAVNTTINFNSTLDNISYADNAAIQAEWIESGAGGNPTIDASDYLEGTASGSFPGTGAGTSVFTASPSSTDLSVLVGVSSGTPTKGWGMLWTKFDDYTRVTSLKMRIGSDSSNYVEITLPIPTSNNWQYRTKKLTTGVVTGNPVFTATDYIAIVVAHTGTIAMKANGFRVNADNSFTLNNVESTPVFGDFRSPQLKPTSLMQVLARTWSFIWYIDYERDIHFVDSETYTSPFPLTDTSANFKDLSVEVDQSQLGNRIIVRGGEKTSSSTYAQVVQGDNALREWVLKTKFNNLIVRVDDNTLTATAEVGTTTTNIKVTAHGLVTGDHVINRTRSNAVRQITVVDANNFTVETVAAQTNGDTISRFGTAKTIGIEGLADETTVNYVYNSNEKSVRAVSATTTLPVTAFIRFAYNERVPIQIQKTDNASANALKALGFGDGIFDLDPITDRNITDVDTALAIATAKIADYRNPIIIGKFKTDKHGLRAGMVITITDSVRGISAQEYLIQSVKVKQTAGEFADYFTYDVSFGTTLFGFIEFYQKLLATKDLIELNTDSEVDTYVDSQEDVEFSEVSVVTKGGTKTATATEDVTTDDSNLIGKTAAGGWHYEPSVGQPFASRYNLAAYG